MKQFILAALMLVIMGERWVDLGPSSLNVASCKSTAGEIFLRCEEMAHSYRRVYVIGERWGQHKGSKTHEPCRDIKKCEIVNKERFTIPVPDAPLKTMTAEEAAKLNKELIR